MAKVKVDSIPKGYEVVDGKLRKKKMAKISADSIPEGYEVVDGKLQKKGWDTDFSLTDPLHLLDAIDAPIREGVYSDEGFFKGIGEHFSRYASEGPIDAIKGTPSKGFLSDLATSPTTYTGIGGLIRAMGKGVAKAGAKGVGKVIEESGKKGTLESLPIRGPTKRGTKATELRLRQLTPQSSVLAKDVRSLAKQAFGNDEIIKHINNPTAMERLLSGRSGVDTIKDASTGKISYKRIPPSGGLIDKKLDEVLDFLEQNKEYFSDLTINRSELVSDLQSGILEEFIDPVTGSHLGEIDMKTISTFIDNLLGKTERLGPAQLLEFKKSLGHRLSPKNFAHDSIHANRTRMLRKAISVLDETIEGQHFALGEMTKEGGEALADVWKAKNREASNLIKLRDIVFAPAYKNLEKSTKNEILIAAMTAGASGAAIGTATTVLTGSPGLGAMAGAGLGAYHLSHKVFDKMLEKLPGWRARGAKTLQPLERLDIPLERSLPMLPKALPGEEGRAPQSLMGEMAGQQIGVNLPDMLVNTPLPRDSEEIMANPKFFLMKVAQQAPEMFDMLKNTIVNDPTAIQELLPSLVEMNPSMFERDPYNRVNGKIMDEMSKLKARKDTMQNPDMPAAEKIAILEKLNRTGEF